MWYKYNKYIQQHSRTAETDVLIEQGAVSRAKKDIVSIVRAKLLETQMYRSINAWRNMKNGDCNFTSFSILVGWKKIQQVY